MKVRLLASSVQDPSRRLYVSTFLINNTVAIDAGCLGFYGTPQEQEAIQHVFLTHSHADHTATLPMFVENTWTPAGNPLQVCGIPPTLDAVQRHIFNDVMWPDFVSLSQKGSPYLHLRSLCAEVPVYAGRLKITPVEVNHLVPTVGYVLSDAESSVIIAGDTGPTTRLWQVAHQTAGLKGVFLESCFPNSMHQLAEKTLHLTPEMFAREAGKMPATVKLVAVHIKTRYREEVVGELHGLGLPNLEIGEGEKEYDF